MKCRFATMDDARLLANLNKQLIEDERHRNPMSFEQLAERMATWLAKDFQAVVFAAGGDVVGYVLYRHEPEHVYIRQFFIGRPYRQQGLGRAAMAWLRRHAWPDAPRLRLDVLVGNEPAIAFWRSVGFRDYCLTMEADAESPAND